MHDERVVLGQLLASERLVVEGAVVRVVVSVCTAETETAAALKAEQARLLLAREASSFHLP